MEISLERLRVKGVFSILSSSFSVLKSIFLFIFNITLVVLLLYVHVSNKLVNNFIFFHSCEVYPAFSKSELYTDDFHFKGQSTVEILSPV